MMKKAYASATVLLALSSKPALARKLRTSLPKNIDADNEHDSFGRRLMSSKARKKKKGGSYEIWGSDQSNSVSNTGCLQAAMSSFGGTYPNADGYVTVCFDGDLSETSGSLSMSVKGLGVSTTGGVHIHTGTSCTDATAQGGHYFNAATTGDPWFNAVNATIAPTGTGYTTDSSGTGRAEFQFDQGYGYDDTVGKVVVVHDTITSLGGTYARVACGKLEAAPSIPAGSTGGYIWIWDAKDVENQVAGGPDAQPLPCNPAESSGPCDLNYIFPGTLQRETKDGTPLECLNDLIPGFGRLHGMLVDPTGRYVAASAFYPSGGYVGVIDTKTREAIALFRVTQTTGTGSQRSVHMNFWSEDGNYIIVSNLHGKMVERIDVERNKSGEITNLRFNLSAGVYLGKNWSLEGEATVFKGANSLGNNLIGEIVGDYNDADTGDLTPTGACKESGCTTSSVPMLGGTRPNNVPICPNPSAEGYVYVTMGGGGLLVLKSDTTPMAIAGEYGNSVFNGAGCAGVEANGYMWLNAGVSASGAGADQSTFGVYAFPDAKFNDNYPSGMAVQNFPFPIQAFKDSTNTNTIGNLDGTDEPNLTGQLPSSSTRRDSHGAGATADHAYVHVGDRIQNVMEVFDTETFERVNTYDLVSATGKGGREGRAGACLNKSVLDDPNLPLNDPAPDLVSRSPDGKYFVVAFRGPKPVSVNHAAQGSCPGAGIVEITEDGKSGKLVGVLRATNTVDDVAVGTIPGGRDYEGAERSDIHHVAIVLK